MSKVSTAAKPNKTKFVLTQPMSLSAKEVIAKGKAIGLKLTDAYVYSIRSKAKQNAGKPPVRRGRPPKSTLIATIGNNTGSTLDASEQRFIGLALDIGLSKATALIQKAREIAASAAA